MPTIPNPIFDDPTAAAVVVPPRMTEEDFVAWRDGEIRAEWVDGEVILMSPVHVEHNRISMWLLQILGVYVEERQLGEIFHSQFVVRLPRPRQRREPDILFVSKGREGIVQPTFVDGPPDFIAEVVSPESAARDWREKHQAYETAGVREYWIIDPQNRLFHAYALDEKNRYLRQPEQDGKVHSVTIAGFWIKPEWLWPETRPTATAVLKELGVL